VTGGDRTGETAEPVRGLPAPFASEAGDRSQGGISRGVGLIAKMRRAKLRMEKWVRKSKGKERRLRLRMCVHEAVQAWVDAEVNE